jgi:hypothetical protein
VELAGAGSVVVAGGAVEDGSAGVVVLVSPSAGGAGSAGAGVAVDGGGVAVEDSGGAEVGGASLDAGGALCAGAGVIAVIGEPCAVVVPSAPACSGSRVLS